jgi:hypothetical protein
MAKELNVQKKISEILFGMGACMLCAPLFLVAWDSYIWLKRGIWPAYTIETVLLEINPDWLLSPQNWLGLHKLVSAISFFPVFILWIPLGILFMKMGAEIGEAS